MRPFTNLLPIVLLLYFSLSACQQQSSSDNAEASSQANTQKELENLAMERGQQIASASQQALASNLKAAIQRGGIEEAFKFCNIQAMPITDSLSRAYDATVKRATLWVRNPKDEATAVEREILEAYQMQMEAGETTGPRLVNLDDQYVLYTQPIAIQNGLCLNCHGEVGTQVQQSTYKLIQERYPEDQATGHQMGDLRGIWSIRFDKSSLQKEEIIGML